MKAFNPYSNNKNTKNSFFYLGQIGNIFQGVNT